LHDTKTTSGCSPLRHRRRYRYPFKVSELSVAEHLDEATLLLNNLLERHVLIAENLIDSRSAVQQLIFQLRSRFEELKNLSQSIAILGELTKRSLDTTASMGELMSSLIFSEAMKAKKYPVVWLDARAFMVTDDHYGNATPLFREIDEKANKVISPILNENNVSSPRALSVQQQRNYDYAWPRRVGLFRRNYRRSIKCRRNPNLDRR